jgi:hypothetical protein
MQTSQPMKRGRPKGSGRYGERTVPVRVPESILHDLGCVDELLRKAKRKLPLFVMGKPSEATMSGNA